MTELIRGSRLLFMLIIIVLLVVFFRSPYFRRLSYPYHHRKIIEKNALEFRVDPLLVAAVIHTESKFDVRAVSPKGALGLMQIMPPTAAWIAQKLKLGSLTKEQILQPETNIRLGAWYLANLTQEFNGQLDLVITAYNGGPGQVNRWLASGVWSGRYADRAEIPFSETREFLERVRTTYLQYQELYR
ncbi:MAG TPA: lytic transglycosylase domain-containing protein [Oscillospiraceae bacterium]|nr:lytic transglycosylase domain-containing protein [Oscillospiraceae bacterium]